MEADIIRQRLIILAIVFIGVIGFLLYLRQNDSIAIDIESMESKIGLDVTPGCLLTGATLFTHDIIDITYRWTTGESYKPPPKKYKVKVHFTDHKGTILFQDDHYPPQSVLDWKPGEIVEYTRTLYVPPLSHQEQVYVLMGLYDEFKPDKTIALHGDMKFPTRYLVSEITIKPTANLKEKLKEASVNFVEGWYQAEKDPSRNKSWRWMGKRGVVEFPNLRSEMVLFINVWIPRQPFASPSTLTIHLNDQQLENTITTYEQLSKKFRVPVQTLGSNDMVPLVFEVNQTYCPRKLGLSPDDRDLGLMLITLFYKRFSQSHPLQQAFPS